MHRAGSRLHCRRCIYDHFQHHPDDHHNPPLTTEEIAWLDALAKMKETFEKIRDKVLRAGTAGVSRALEALLGKTVGACSRDLARIGPPPSDRLQPVYTLAKKACQQFTKAARCHATVVRLSLPSGGVVVGSPQERPWKQASRCAHTRTIKNHGYRARALRPGWLTAVRPVGRLATIWRRWVPLTGRRPCLPSGPPGHA